MPPFLKSMTKFLSSPPLIEFWILFASLILGCYLVALLLAHAMRSQTTVIHRCRRAWGLAFLLHALASIAVCVHWYLSNRMLADIGRFVPFYVVMIIIDLIIGLGLVTAARRFTSYRDNKS